ncbi:MAG: hypothetical protein ABJH04_07950 [Cyclobacteriaceae bacterium]
MANSVKNVLMTRDGLTEQEAENQINEVRERIFEGEDPEDLIMDELGLEPDYLEDILF